MKGEQAAGQQPDVLLVLGRIEVEHDLICLSLLAGPGKAAAQPGEDGPAVGRGIAVVGGEVAVDAIQEGDELAALFGDRLGGCGRCHAAVSGSGAVNAATPLWKIRIRACRARW